MNIDLIKYIKQVVMFAALSVMSFATMSAVEEYNVLGGTFFMDGGVTASPKPINGKAGGTFSDAVPPFLGDFSCGGDALCNAPQPRFFIEADATDTGLQSFDFFGQPVYTYFASNGADGDAVNHPAPSITLSADYITGTANMESWYANWNGIEFLQGAAATVANNFDGSYTVKWTQLIVDGPFDGFNGTWNWIVECVTCPPIDLDPRPVLEVRRGVAVPAATGGTLTRNVAKGDPLGIKIVGLPGFPTNYAYNFVDTSDELDGGAVRGNCAVCTNNATVDHDPLFLATSSGFVTEGPHNISVTIVFDDGMNPVRVSRASVIVNVMPALTDIAALGLDDADNDGIPDIDDVVDNLTTPTITSTQAGNSTTFLMETSAGSLAAGLTAQCAGTSSTGISESDLTSFGGVGCTAIPADVLGSTVAGIGGYFDFEVHGLAQGASVDIVIPLTESMPNNASYRKYSFKNGWKAFDVSTGDSLASTSSTSAGVCPAPADASWTTGLTAGDDCIRLSITDGGPNDADTLADGVVLDPGSVTATANTSSIDLGGCSVSGKPTNLSQHMEWLLLTVFIVWLGLVRRKAAQ